MGILRSEGFDALIAGLAADMAGCGTVREAVALGGSFGGRSGPGGTSSSSRVEAVLEAAAADAGAGLDPYAANRERLLLTRTGRTRLLRATDADPDGGHPVGAIQWADRRPADLDARLAVAAAADRAEAAAVQAWLVAQPAGTADRLIAEVRDALLHMAPVVLYCGDRVYTNLGKHSTLTGKSLRPTAEGCTLRRLESLPVAAWAAEDACFLVCLHALIHSGPAVRAEEFNGGQVRPDRLVGFFTGLLAGYGAAEPVTVGGLVERLYGLSAACAAARAELVARGGRPYRRILGLTLNKQEAVLREPVRLAEAPASFTETLGIVLESPSPRDFADVAAACADAVPDLVQPGDESFPTLLEQVLHELVLVAATATGSDVAMSRGPRELSALGRMLGTGDTGYLSWTTKNFYCCVAPSENFVRLFTTAPQQLPQALRAIAARMCYNGWHYLPHTAGLAEIPGSRDWFFAPTMADVTDWSDQHHTGHVVHGVRYAIRVPFGLQLAGAHRPGSHDVRLMRTAGAPYQLADLRSAMAVGEVFRLLYQAWADHLAGAGGGPDVTAFENDWYARRYQDLDPVPAGAAR